MTSRPRSGVSQPSRTLLRCFKVRASPPSSSARLRPSRSPNSEKTNSKAVMAAPPSPARPPRLSRRRPRIASGRRSPPDPGYSRYPRYPQAESAWPNRAGVSGSFCAGTRPSGNGECGPGPPEPRKGRNRKESTGPKRRRGERKEEARGRRESESRTHFPDAVRRNSSPPGERTAKGRYGGASALNDGRAGRGLEGQTSEKAFRGKRRKAFGPSARTQIGDRSRSRKAEAAETEGNRTKPQGLERYPNRDADIRLRPNGNVSQGTDRSSDILGEPIGTDRGRKASAGTFRENLEPSPPPGGFAQGKRPSPHRRGTQTLGQWGPAATPAPISRPRPRRRKCRQCPGRRPAKTGTRRRPDCPTAPARPGIRAYSTSRGGSPARPDPTGGQ